MGASDSKAGKSANGAAGADGEEIAPWALVVAGPSGVGKGTLISRLTKEYQEYFGFSVSHTTRPPRPKEQDGVHYHFVTKAAMEEGIAAGSFLEYAEVHGHYYGSSVKAVEEVLEKGQCCVLDIDVQGARQVRASGINCIFVFIAPPSTEELERRLRNRGTESEDAIQQRLANAKGELEAMQEPGLFDYVVVNDDLDSAFQKFLTIAARALQGIGPESEEVADEPENAADIAAEEQRLLQTPEKRPAVSCDSIRGVQPASSPAVAQGRSGSTTATPKMTSPTKTQSPVLTAAHERVADAVDGSGTITIPPGMDKWRGKVALVTGASAGIGWAACQALALAGMRVVAVARRRERLEQLQHAVLSTGITNTEFLPVVCDITKEAEVMALPKIVSKRWPNAGIDVLVNNAGLARNNASLFDGSTASWVEMVSTNVLALCMCTRETVRNMKERSQWGHVINICSLGGHRLAPPEAGVPAFYAATKHAVRALTEGLRLEARQQNVPLRVSEISPGRVDTEFHNVMTFDEPPSTSKSEPALSALHAEDIAQAVLWCLSAPQHVEVNDVLVRPTSQRF